MGSKEQQRVTCHSQHPDWPLKFLCLVPLKLNPPAKFDVCTFSLSRDNRGPKIQSWSPDLAHAHFWPNFYFFCLAFATLDLSAKFDVCSFFLKGDNRGPKIQK